MTSNAACLDDQEARPISPTGLPEPGAEIDEEREGDTDDGLLDGYLPQ